MPQRRKRAKEHTSEARSTFILPDAQQPPSPVIGLHVMPAGPRFMFAAFMEKRRAKRFLTIGTSRRCDIQLEDPSVSRVHCGIRLRGAQVLVDDMESKNGLLLNGRRVASCELHGGDVLPLGLVAMAAISEAEETPRMVMACSSFSQQGPR